jgi:hypothetical protein
VKFAVKADLVGFALHAIDGTKLAAASSMETAQHRKVLEERLKKLDSIVNASIAATEAAEKLEQGSYALPESLRDAKERKAKVAELLAELDEAETNHRHRKDPNARVMRSRQGRILGFNAQAVVDETSDLILAADVSGDETDYAQLVPMLQQVSDNTGANAEQSIADAGYWSGAQLAEAEKRHLPVLVSEQSESSAKGEFSKSNFTYDAERNAYICPRNEVLQHEGTWSPTTGREYRTFLYRCRNTECPVRSDCTQATGRGMLPRLSSLSTHHKFVGAVRGRVDSAGSVLGLISRHFWRPGLKSRGSGSWASLRGQVLPPREDSAWVD